MRVVKTIPFDYASLDDVLTTLYNYWLEAAQDKNMKREDFYRAYMVKKFYERVRKRQEAMLTDGRKTVKVKFDVVHAVLLVDVLQRCRSNDSVQVVLFHLGAVCPPQMSKNNPV